MLESGREAVVRLGAALQYRDYRTLWLANACGGAASWALIVARGWLVYELSGSSALVGVATFAAMIPRFFITPFSGYMVDRFDRRRVLALSYGVNLAHNIVLAVLVLGGGVEVWHLLVLSLVNGSARATQMPASSSLIPNLVPRQHLLNAVALNSATQQGSRLLGPAAIAPLLATVGPGGAFVLCSLFYAVGLIQVLRIRTASRGAVDRSKGIMENLLAGLVYVYRHPLLFPFLMVAVAHCALTMSFESLLPVLSREKLGAEGAGFSYLMMAVGAGALLMSLALAAVRDQRTRGRLLVVLGVLSGLGPVALAVSPSLSLALVAAALMGAAQAGFMTLFHVVVQSIVPDGIRGRVSAIDNLHIGGMMATFNLVSGFLADIITAPMVLGATGIAFVVTIAASFLSVHLRDLYAARTGVLVAPA
jgi:MFS family permease